MGKKILMLFVCTMLSASMAWAQTRTVTGTVVDSETGEPIPGAQVKVQGTNLGAVADSKGTFVLKDLPKDAKKVIVSFMGMKTADVTIKDGMKVILIPDTKAMDEVMVVAYGTATKETYTGAASIVSSEIIEERQVSNLSNVLAGNVAGVTAFSANGQPGTGSTVQIRGFGSINAGSNPLYVLDGMPYEGDLSAINPDDVESMSVLKDAAAAALYGARGANGVIMITTKKGRQSRDAKISFNSSWGSNSRQVKNYKVINDPYRYTEMLYKANYNNGIYRSGLSETSAHEYANKKALTGTGYQVFTVAPGQDLVLPGGAFNYNGATLGYSDGQYYYTPDNWEKESFRNGLRQEYNLSINGGTDKLQYYANVGYLDDEGIIKQSSFKRISTRLNVDYQAKKWLKFMANVAYTNSTSNYPDEQTSENATSSANTFFIAYRMSPIYPMYVRDGQTGALLYNGNTPVYDYGDKTTGNFTRNFMSISNPIGDLTYNTSKYLMDIFNSRWGIEIKPVRGLTLTARLGMNLDNTRYHYASSGLYGQSVSTGGEAVQEQIRELGITQQYMANYHRIFADKHTLDLLGVYESYDWQYEYVEGYGQNLYRPGSWAVSNAIDERRGYGEQDKYATRSVLGRINYDYAEKYFVSLSMRGDGSSRFAPSHRWGLFWSASAAWNMKKESWLAEVRWIDLLKIRASFGQQGNDNIGNRYAYVDQYKVTGSDGVFSDGELTYKANPDLTWEKSDAYDLAVDFNFWKGRLSGSIDFYSRTTRDMLYYKPVAPSNGYSSIPMNIGSMRNRGIEIDLHSQVFNTKNFSWNIDYNIAYNSNVIVALSPDLGGQLISGSTILREGHSMYEYYLVKYAGVNQTNGLAQYWAKDSQGNEYATTDFATARNTNRQATGDLQANWFGGLATQLKYRGFDLSLQCSYQFGGRMYDNTYQDLMTNLGANDAGQAIHQDMLRAWTPENTSTDVPRLCADDEYSNATSTRFLITSNYFAINNLTFGYTLPEKLLSKAHISSLRFYVSGDNLAVFSARQGLDPRVSVRSANNATYNTMRTISGGVKITF